MILAPLLIFGLAPVPGLGVAGAAIATVTAPLIVTLVLSMRRDAMSAFQMPIWQPIPLFTINNGAPQYRACSTVVFTWCSHVLSLSGESCLPHACWFSAQRLASVLIYMRLK